MTDLTSICGQVQGLTPQLLQRSQIDRMVGAKNADEAFRILGELQYADYIDQSTDITDFDAIITQGLFETKVLITSGASEHPVNAFLTLPFDINNLKRALKQRLIEGASEFVVDSSYSKLGTLTVAEINKIVFEGTPAGSISEIILVAVAQVITEFNKDSEIRDMEFKLDGALFAALGALIEETPSEFLTEYLSTWADSVQVRNIARSILIMGEPLPAAAFVPAGSITLELVGKAETAADLKRLLERSRFSILASKIEDNATPATQILQLEQALDTTLRESLHEAAVGSLSSPAILLDYFNERLHNARTLKLIMYGKLNGVAADKIYKLLEA